MAIHKTEVIVLKTIPFRSSSLIVSCFSKDFGKVKGIVKGVRQASERRTALFELFSHVEIIFYEKLRSDLHLITDAFLIESFEAVKTKLEAISYASYFCELTDELTEVFDPHPGIFEALKFVYRFLPSLSGERVARLFEIKLFNEIGWLPYLERCLHCSDSHFENGFFSARQGAIICPRCRSQYSDALPISSEALKLMRFYVAHDMELSIRQGMSPKTEKELQLHMSRFLQERHTKPLKSLQFMSRIKPQLLNS